MYKITFMRTDDGYPMFHYFQSLLDLADWWKWDNASLLDLLFDKLVCFDDITFNLEEVDE